MIGQLVVYYHNNNIFRAWEIRKERVLTFRENNWCDQWQYVNGYQAAVKRAFYNGKSNRVLAAASFDTERFAKIIGTHQQRPI
jgi:CTP:phosphocholine cytidylyltransferase-like protein